MLCASIYASELSPETLVVQRGTAKITLGDVDAYLEQHVPSKDRAGFMNSPKRIENLLLTMLLHRQLADDARAHQLDQDEQVRHRLAVASDEILSQQRLVQATKDLQIPDMEPLAREKYATNKASYVALGQVDVKHILINTKTRSSKEALDLANDVAEQARNNPDGFDALIEKYSEDPTKSETGGAVADAASSQYDKSFVKAVGEMKNVGDISHPVRSSFGLHIIKLVKREPDRQKSFEEVRDVLISQLTEDFVTQRRKDVRDKFANEKMDANPDAVASLRDRYNNAPSPAVAAPADDAPSQNVP